MVDKVRSSRSANSALEAREPQESNLLVIRSRKGQRLSKEQRSFNRLTRQIAQLESRIAAERERMDLLMGRFVEIVAPMEQELASRKIDLARALAAACDRFALRKRQLEDLRQLLLNLLDDAFFVTKPDAETEMLYDKWSDLSYREELRQQAELRKRKLADLLRAEYGIKVDVSEEEQSPDVLERLLRDAHRKAREADAGKPRSGARRRRGPMQEGREEEIREREALATKSVRDIYLSLAKVLHPDTVSDATERSLREDYMKQAAFAYRQGDLTALLKLELRWVIRAKAGQNALADDTLRVYITALKAQLERLERALVDQIFDPRYAAISPVAGMSESEAVDRLHDRAQDLRLQSKAIEQEAGFVRSCGSKTAFTTFLRDCIRGAAGW